MMEKTESHERATIRRSLDISAELQDEIRDAADAVGMSSAAFIRMAARRAADQVLGDGRSADEVLRTEKSAQLPRWMREIRDILNTVGNEGSQKKFDYSGH